MGITQRLWGHPGVMGDTRWVIRSTPGIVGSILGVMESTLGVMGTLGGRGDIKGILDSTQKVVWDTR